MHTLSLTVTVTINLVSSAYSDCNYIAMRHSFCYSLHVIYKYYNTKLMHPIVLCVTKLMKLKAKTWYYVACSQGI